MSGKLDITPDTRVGPLLAAYPELEAVLIEFAPAFKALRNPVLRRTVAQVATLRRAAGVAGVSPRELVTALREAAGLAEAEVATHSEAERTTGPSLASEESRPAWCEESLVRVTLDADALLAAGETPLTRVTQALRDDPDGIVRLVSSFEPTPLIEALEKAGHRVWGLRRGAREYLTFFAGRELTDGIDTRT